MNYNNSFIKYLPDEDISIFSNLKNIRRVIYERYHSTEIDSEYDAMALLEYFYKLRHDLLHYNICKMIDIKPQNEFKIGDIINKLNRNKNKTPDIIFLEGVLKIIEISVSVDYEQSRQKKYEKYEDLLNELDELNIANIFETVCVSPTLNNLDNEIEKIKKITSKNMGFDYHGYSSIHNDLTEVIENVRKKISNEFDKWYKKTTNVNWDYNLKTNVLMKDIELKVNEDIHEKKYEYYNNLKNIERHDLFGENELCDYLKNVLENDLNEVNVKYADTINNSLKYDLAREKIHKNTNERNIMTDPKPTHHILIPQSNYKFNGSSEQENIDALFAYIYANMDNINLEGDDGRLNYVFELVKTKKRIDSNPNKNINNQNKRMYNYGRYLESDELESSFKFKYMKIVDEINENNKNNKRKYNQKHEEIKEDKKPPSYINFLRENGLVEVDTDKDYYCKQNTIKLSKDSYKNIDNDFHKHAGIGARGDLTMKEKEIKIKKEYRSLQFGEEHVIDDFFYTMSLDHNDDREIPKILNYLSADPGKDNEVLYNQKQKYKEIYMKFIDKLVLKNCFWYSYINHIMYKQLFYHSTIRMDSKMIVLCGLNISGYAMIINGCYSHPEDSPGKPFMCIYLTSRPEIYCNGLYGDVRSYYIKKQDMYICITNWRRLNMSKITHCKDSFYSTLSSTIGSCMNSIDEITMSEQKLQKIYTHRVLLSLCTSQSVQELMMNTRYAYMSAFSSHTNIIKLLEEKFGPPYKNHLHIWTVNRLLRGLPLLHTSVYKGGNVSLNKPKFKQKIRDEESIGGDIRLPSVWYNDEYMFDPQDVLDETFIYIHTMKEPSSIYHEQIKAINTIVDFEEEYKEIKQICPEFVNGNMSIVDINKFLISNFRIGYCAQVIKFSTKRNIDIEKPSIENVTTKINNEPLSEIISTKAVIHDINRNIEEYKLPKSEIKRQIERYRVISGKEITEEDLQKIKKERYIVTESVYNLNKPRQKLMETIMTILEKNPTFKKTMNLVDDFIKKDCPVLSDICIKSQYGSKREFYVINIEAKSAARCVENFYKYMCENSPNEAISIPGDKKLIEMQKMLDDAYRIKGNRYLRYVNGDCTKWSAAETMGSFIAMTNAMGDLLGNNLKNLINLTFCSWADKEIQIPLNLLSKSYDITDRVKQLREKSTINRRLHSTQNFLQGMFNYASSYKSVCCSSYTYYLWKKIYPTSNLDIKYMVHSDDYVTIILYDNEDEFKKYRILNKIMMKLHGFSDSERKTSCQSTFMEFVSLMSFNGNMMYPKIKKMKDVNSNLPCLGYRYDVDTVLSRVGECLRIGCNLSYCYFFQRLHLSLVMENYSLQPGMRNNKEYSYRDLQSRPAEMYGCPDPHPIYSLFCKGNSNNYRLYKYDNDGKIFLKYLYKRAIEKEVDLSGSKIDSQYGFTIYNPNYIHEDIRSAIIPIRRKIGMKGEELKKFWNDHIMYKFLKPVDRDLLYDWIKAMFYDRSFAEAYIQSSRVQLTLRVSRYSSGRVIKEQLDYPNYDCYEDYIKSALTIQEFITLINKDIIDININKEDDQNLFKIITKCDPTYESIDEITKKMTFGHTIRRRQQIAIRTPYPTTTYTISNNPAIIMQYLINSDDFKKDERVVKSEISFKKDIDLVVEKLGFNPETKNSMEVLMCYNDLVQLRGERIVMIGYNRDSLTIEDVLRDLYTHQNEPYYSTRVNMPNTNIIRHPHTGETMYKREHKYVKSTLSQQIATLSTIHIYMRKILNYNYIQCKEFLDNTEWLINDDKNVNFRTFLENISWELLDKNEISFKDIKCIAYLKCVYLYDYEIIKELTKSVYSYSYNYIQESQKIGGSYTGECVFTFIYLKKKYLCYYDEKEKIPYLFTNQNYGNYNIPAYNIARRLCNEISENEFLANLHTDKLKNIHIETSQMQRIQLKLKRKIVGYLYKEEKDNKIVEKPQKSDENIPIFITNDLIIHTEHNKSITSQYNPIVNDDYYCVYLGKNKLYNYPQTGFDFYPVVRYKGSTKWDNFDVNEIFKTNILSCYLNKKKLNTNLSVQINKELLNDLSKKINWNNNYKEFIEKYDLETINQFNTEIGEKLKEFALVENEKEREDFHEEYEDQEDNYINNEEDPVKKMNMGNAIDDLYNDIGLLDMFKENIENMENEEILYNYKEENEKMDLPDITNDVTFMIHREKRGKVFTNQQIKSERMLNIQNQIIYELYTETFPKYIDCGLFLNHYNKLINTYKECKSLISLFEIGFTIYHYITNTHLTECDNQSHKIVYSNNMVKYYRKKTYKVGNSDEFRDKQDYKIINKTTITKIVEVDIKEFLSSYSLYTQNNLKIMSMNLPKIKFINQLNIKEESNELEEIFI